MSVLYGKSVLVTGGTGSFGSSLVKRLLNEDEVTKVVIFSRDELKQFELSQELKSPKLRFFLGDVRDYQRLLRATDGIDIVVHAAAMKQIPASEYNPMEAIKTNIIGAENIVNVAIENNVSKVIALSTDKAANPANLYGATKLCSDKLMIAGNVLKGSRDVSFAVVRYGNVLGSRGSVVPFFIEKAREGKIPITDERMTRFWLTLGEGVQFVLDSLARMRGGEIFVPKIPSLGILDVAAVVAPHIATHTIGIRPGEKLHEVMITEDDALNTFEFDSYFAIVSPTVPSRLQYDADAKRVDDGFRYASDNNPWWHTRDSFKEVLVKQGLI